MLDGCKAVANVEKKEKNSRWCGGDIFKRIYGTISGILNQTDVPIKKVPKER